MSVNNIRSESVKKAVVRHSADGPIYFAEFKSLFEKYYRDSGYKVCPVIRDGQVDEGSSRDDPQILISYKSFSNEDMEKICYKNYRINDGIIVALQKLLVNVGISILKLEFCNMTARQVELLCGIVSHTTSITELSLNGNPNEQQNFHLLLKDTPLQSLSLRFCGIDRIGIEKISNALNTPYDSCLLHLNLSSNSICDEGVCRIAQFLRINRTLVSLNLADNKIYDEGCLLLVQPLKKFQLNLEEIIVRRRIRFSLLRKAGQKVVSISIHNVSKSSKKTGISPEPSQVSEVSEKTENNYLEETSTKQDIENHPFVEDSYEEDKEIYCKGNNTLLNLNLSYNRITKAGLTALIEMMNYQRENNAFANDKGISRISVEGNDFKNNCEQELQELEKLIKEKLGLKSSNTSMSLGSKDKSQTSLSMKKRRSTKRSIV